MRDPNTLDEVSKERFEGTILKAISKTMKKIKLEPVEERGGSEVGQMALTQVQEKFSSSNEPLYISSVLKQFIVFTERHSCLEEAI